MSRRSSVKNPAGSLLLGLLLMPLVAAAETPADEPRPALVTKQGELAGVLDRGIQVFRGIPYAAPPVGALRWEPPQAPAAWQGVRDATTFGPSCPLPKGLASNGQAQVSSGTRSVHEPGFDIWLGEMDPSTSEDCLTLNVWAPHPMPTKVPVIVFFSPTGGGAVPFFDGRAFARDGIVFVSPNTRLFTQSLFAHPALTRAALPDKAAIRFVELDRVAVLEWVRDNIGKLGGDPGNVTVVGQSNSGVSILSLMTLPQAKGLFQRAIVQSGSSRGGSPIGAAGMERIGAEFATLAGLDGAKATAEELRALPLDALPFFAGGTVNDTATEHNVAQLFELGRTLAVDLLIGGNDWDGSSLRYPAATIVERTPEDVRGAYAHEGLSGDALGYAIYTDEHVNAPARWYAAAQTRRGARAYLYVYSHKSAFRGPRPGAGHGDELPYVFDSWSTIPGLERVLNDEDRRVTKIMHECWVAFARTGTPQCDGVPEWPAFDEANDWTMELNGHPQLHRNYRDAQYSAHDRDAERNPPPATRDGFDVIEALRTVR
jgi:para-nitrobenzyl esterase